MNLYLIQHDVVWEDPAATLEGLEKFLGGFAPEKNSLIVFPEMFSTGFSMNPEKTTEAPGGLAESFLKDLARNTSCHVLGGLVQEVQGPQNLARLYSPQGETLLSYAKNRPFSPMEEGKHYPAGSEVLVADLLGLKVCPLICYDLRFPELFQQGLKQGAELFIVIANWPKVREEHRSTLLKARAIENQAFVAGVNRVGKDPNVEYQGESLLFGPKGEELARAGDGAQIVEAKIDSKTVRQWRAEFPAWQER